MLPLISIILPVYNMSGKLPRCIASLTAQTYPNLEFLFVDDGSTDNSVQVIQQYADSRFRILRKKNGGVSSARNEGLRNMRGEYGAFVDPDDTVSPNYIQYLYDALMAQGTKMSCCWTYELHEDDADKPLPDEPHQPAKLATFDNYDQWGEMAHVQSYGVLYHHDLLENLRFDKREEKNDPEFAKELGGHAVLHAGSSGDEARGVPDRPALLLCAVDRFGDAPKIYDKAVFGRDGVGGRLPDDEGRCAADAPNVDDAVLLCVHAGVLLLLHERAGLHGAAAGCHQAFARELALGAEDADAE